MYIASLVMGLVSIALSWIPVLGFIIAIAAIIVAIIAMAIKNPENKGKKMEIAGLILSIVAVLVSLAVIILPLIMVKAVVGVGTELIDEVVTEGMEQVDDIVNNSADTMDNFVDDFVNTVDDTASKNDDVLNETTDNNKEEEKTSVIDEIIDKQEKLDEASKKIDNISSSLQMQILQSYDNKVLSGVQARAAIMQYMTTNDLTVVLMSADETKMIATVGAKQLADGSVTAKKGFYEIEMDDYSAEGGSLHKTSITDFSNPQSETAISTAKNYKSYLLKIAGTDNIVGIVFAEQQ